MNIEEIKMDHFENFEELIKTCKMWIRDDDIDAYYRFFEFNCMKALVTAYEKEKEEKERIGKLYYEANENCIKYEKYYEEMEEVNKKFIAVDKIKAKIKEIEKDKYISNSDFIEFAEYARDYAKKKVQSLLEKE